jgi:HTH-type transcriptional regulator/antitoxin HigA
VTIMTEPLINQYRPKRVSPPGDTLADLMDERDLKQAELATRMDVSAKFINELIAGKVTISPATALALERALDIPADFWLTRDVRYREHLARKHAEDELSAHTNWLKELPLNEMWRYEWIRRRESDVANVEECLQYFGVASVPAWRAQYVDRTVTSAAYRISKHSRADQGSIAAWLRQGEIEAARLECAEFDRAQLLPAIESARSLTCEDEPSSFVPKLVNLFSSLGVAVVFVRSPKGCPVSGAVRWVSPKKALIQLSFRYMRNDSLWFTFFHECGHVYLHGKKMLFLEGGKIASPEEEEADKFASDKLIPPSDWAQFCRDMPSEHHIVEFAKRIGIHPGIIVGRLQNEGRLAWSSRLNGFKVRYVWKDSI